MLKKTPDHIISEQKSAPTPAAHPDTDTYRKLPTPEFGPLEGRLLIKHKSSPHLNQNSTLRRNKSIQQQDQPNTETLELQKSNSRIPVGPTKDRASSPNQLN